MSLKIKDTFCGGTMEFSIETQNYPKVNPRHLVEACGILPEWAIQTFLEVRAGREIGESKSPVELMDMHYKFGIHEDVVGQINPENGFFTYPGDPVEKPLMYIKDKKLNMTFWFYRHAVIAIPKIEGGWCRVRMD